MLKIYGDLRSGNCYKVRLLLALIASEHQWVHVDMLRTDAQDEKILALNPSGKIPVLQLHDGRILCESNAIVSYLAEGTSLVPMGNFERAKMFEWLFFEQYSLEPYIAVARFIQTFLGMPDSRLDEYKALHERGYKALDLMNSALAKSEYFLGDSLSVADLSLFAYSHVAHEGGYELANYSNLQRWIMSIQEQDGFVSIGE